MKKHILSLACLLCWLPCEAAEYPSTFGTSFTFAFMENPGQGTQGSDRFIISAPDGAASGTVSCPGYSWQKSFSVHQGGAVEVAVNTSLRVSAGLESKAYYVTASSPVSVYALTSEVFTSDGTVVYPNAYLGTEHYVMSYTPLHYASSFLVVAAESEATFTAYRRVGGAWSTHLRGHVAAGQTFYVSSLTSDYTGVKIESTAPVAVISGGECLEVPGPPSAGAPQRFYSGGYCDVIVEQMPPPLFWGTKHVSFSNPARPAAHKDVFRVLAVSSGTVTLTSGANYTVTEGGYVEFEIESRAEELITCSAYCIVMMYNKRTQGFQPTFGTTDPFMVHVVPVDMWAGQYVVTTTNTASGIAYAHTHASLVAASQDASSILINGIVPTGSTWRHVTGTTYSAMDVTMTSGQNLFITSADGAVFGLYVTGQATYDAYSYTAGLLSSTALPDTSTAFPWWVVGVAVAGLLVLGAVAVLLWYFLKYKKRKAAEVFAVRRVLSQISILSSEFGMDKEKEPMFYEDPHSFLSKPINHRPTTFYRVKSATKVKQVMWIPEN